MALLLYWSAVSVSLAAVFVPDVMAGRIPTAKCRPRPPIVPTFPQALAFRLELPPEDKIPDGSKGDEEGKQHHEVYPKLRANNVHLLQELPRRLVMAVWLGAVQRFPIKAVYTQQRALEAVSEGGEEGG